MKRLALVACVALYACSNPATSLPGGYMVKHGDRGKAWLQNPDGTIAHGGLIKALYHDKRHILLLTYTTSYGGIASPPVPIDRSCYVALLFNVSTHSVKQLTVADAAKLSARMVRVETYERPCLPGMSNTVSR
jgi:hypothetical protein